jgi:hypothetical protein
MAMEERKFLTDRGKVVSGIMASIFGVIKGCPRCEKALRDYGEASGEGNGDDSEE